MLIAMVRCAIAIALGIAIGGSIAITTPAAAQQTRRYLYVAVPGAGNESEYRGVGILVYDIDNGLALWCVSDNLRKGAALNAIQIAECLINRKLIEAKRKAA